jgi:hypothetical protein
MDQIDSAAELVDPEDTIASALDVGAAKERDPDRLPFGPKEVLAVAGRVEPAIKGDAGNGQGAFGHVVRAREMTE